LLCYATDSHAPVDQEQLAASALLELAAVPRVYEPVSVSQTCNKEFFY
jgi:hypothetical protein